ncbi:MAG: TIGR01212 family radical SAM protein [Marinifilaceae bacterium]
MTSQKRYKDFPTFFKTLFNQRVQKLSIDGGFTCPNRDGSRGVGGCTFCNNKSFNPDYCRSTSSITQQIEEGINFFDHKYSGQYYLAYFQAYSNTYAPLEVLKQKYEEALSHPKVKGLVIGTRPDAITEEVLNYLQDLAKRYYICVEYGIESTNNTILDAINRGHHYEEAERIIKLSANRGLVIGAHLIFGLPGESYQSMLDGAIKVSNLPIDVLKFHQLQIVKDTRMSTQYQQNAESFHLYDVKDYLQFMCDVIARMNPNVYLERFVNQSPPEYLIAPKWGVKNFEFVAKLDKLLQSQNITQGMLWNKEE